MLVYGALVPHSVSLHALVTGTHGIPASVEKAFATIAADMHGRGVRTVVSLGTHPHYRRQGFSAYVARCYTLGFKNLGDLTNETQVDVAWDVFHALREQALGDMPVVHPLDEGVLDTSHALPLWIIKQHLPQDYKIRVLCINDAPAASRDERLAFGQALRLVLNSLSHESALLVSQECVLSDTVAGGALDAMKAANLAIRYQASGLWSKTDPRLETASPCFTGPAFLAYPSFSQPQPWAYEELAFEHVGLTSVLAARLLPPPQP